LKIISETNFETGGKIKNRIGSNSNRTGPLPKKPERAGPIPLHRAGEFSNFESDKWGLPVSLIFKTRTGTSPWDQDPTVLDRRLPRAGQELTGVAERRCSTAGLNGEEAVLVGGEAERRRRLDSFAWHRRRLQRWPESFGTRQRTHAELGHFRGEEEEGEAGNGGGGGVVFWGVEGLLL
jgi:hypothetical protein